MTNSRIYLIVHDAPVFEPPKWVAGYWVTWRKMARELIFNRNQRFVNVRSVTGEKPKRMPGSGGCSALIASPSLSAVADKTSKVEGRNVILSLAGFSGQRASSRSGSATYVPVQMSLWYQKLQYYSVAHYSAIILVTLVQKLYLNHNYCR